MVHNYKYVEQKGGRGNFAYISLVIEESDQRNSISENYNGQGFYSQGYTESVPTKGYDDWKKGAIDGLNQALKLTTKMYKITINAIEGLCTDTNSQTVAYTAFLALCSYLNLEVEENVKKEFEERITQCWIEIRKEIQNDPK